jgi:fatty acid desaturase
MSGEKKEQKITWYRSPVQHDILATLNQRSDRKGLLQTLSHLGLLGLTGTLAWYSAGHLPLPALLVFLFLHGTFWAFLLNAFHELCHKTVFKNNTLNTVFLYLISFLSWNNPILFWASHQEHHKYTLHPPDDLEVVLPQKLSLSALVTS